MTYSIQAQNNIYKKIAQRSDEYSNNSWKGKDSFLYNYNADTSITLLQHFQFSAMNTWDNDFRYTSTYTINNQLATQIRENWDGTNWINYSKYTYNYDANGNLLLIYYETWNGSNWIPTGKIEYNGYNAYGKYANEIMSNYSGGAWIFQSKKEKKYQNNQTLVEQEDKFVWDGINQNWKKLERLFYTYIQNQIGSITRFVPDIFDVWQAQNQYTYNYNLSPLRITQYLAQNFDTALNNWINISKMSYLYNAFDSLDKTQTELFINNSWQASSRVQYLYNANQWNSETIYENANNGNWDKFKKNMYSYNNNGFKIEENQFIGNNNTWLPNKNFYYNYDAFSNLIYEKREDYNGANFTPFSQTFYYYELFPLSMSEDFLNSNSIKIFPNPASDKIYFSIENKMSSVYQIQIQDLQGNIRLSRTQSSNNLPIEISIYEIQNGIYLVHFIDLKSREKSTQKIIIQH